MNKYKYLLATFGVLLFLQNNAFAKDTKPKEDKTWKNPIEGSYGSKKGYHIAIVKAEDELKFKDAHKFFTGNMDISNYKCTNVIPLDINRVYWQRTPPPVSPIEIQEILPDALDSDVQILQNKMRQVKDTGYVGLDAIFYLTYDYNRKQAIMNSLSNNVGAIPYETRRNIDKNQLEAWQMRDMLCETLSLIAKDKEQF